MSACCAAARTLALLLALTLLVLAGCGGSDRVPSTIRTSTEPGMKRAVDPHQPDRQMKATPEEATAHHRQRDHRKQRITAPGSSKQPRRGNRNKQDHAPRPAGCP